MINEAQILSSVLAIGGVVLLVLALLLIKRVRILFADVERKGTWKILERLIVFFLISYPIAIAMIMAGNQIALQITLGVLLMVGALFVYVVVETSMTTLIEMKDRGTKFWSLTKEVQDYAIIMLDKEGHILSWNKGAEKIKGYMAEDILGESFLKFYTAEDRKNGVPHKLLKEALVNGRSAGEGYRLRKDGTTFWGSISLTAIHDSKGNVTGFSKVTRDLTERKAAEHAQQQYMHQLEAKNSELEQFTYIASHDIQEPLNTLTTLTGILREDHSADMGPDGMQAMEYIDETIARMSQLIKGLLDYGRIGNAKQMEAVDTYSIVNDVQRDLKSAIDASKALIEYNSLPKINAYAVEFRMLLQNLIGNAIKFRKQNVNPVVKVNAKERKNDWLFEIVDNGIGISPASVERIFVIFQRLHARDEYEGTGIGLAHCKKIVEIHGGKIWVESEPGLGSTFSFTIAKNRK